MLCAYGMRALSHLNDTFFLTRYGLHMLSYFIKIPKGKMILWCYLIWYCVTLYFYFDPSIRIWINSLGISVVIGIALMLSVTKQPGAATDHWQTFRLFAMPFCVSSFSSLIKGKGFIFIIPPHPVEQLTAIGFCAAFIGLVILLKLCTKSSLQK